MQEALSILEKDSNSCVLQPTVAIFCGDVNLDQDNANACCQPRNGDATPNVLNQWHTQTSSAALSGDVAFVRGCESQAFDVTIGRSYQDRGIRNDSHDFFGVTIAVPLFTMPPDKKLRQVRFAVPELSVEDAAEDSEMNSASVSQRSVVGVAMEELSVEDAAKDSEMNSASVSQPSVSHTASLYQNSVRDAASAAAQEDSEMNNTDNPYGVDWGDDARSSLPDTASVSQPSARVAVSWAFDAIVEDMKDWYSWAKTIG